MKKIFLLGCFLASFTALMAQKSGKSSSSKKTESVTLDLTDALARKMVAVTTEALGGHQGESMRVTVRNLGSKPVRVRMPQGQLLEPADSSFQTLVVAAAKTISVGAKTPGQCLVRTFCTQAGDRSPSAGTAFALGAQAPEKICQLLRYLSQQGKLDDGSAQAAVWCLTNGDALAGIGDPALQKFMAELTGKPLPGYRVKYETTRVIPGERADLGKALVVESSFTFTLDKEERLSLFLCDSTGKTVKTVFKDELNIAGEHRTGLHLEVYNLPRGKYKLRLLTKTGRAIQEMEVEF